MNIETSKEVVSKPQVLEANTIINNPNELLEFLGEGWITEEEDYNTRTFNHRLEDVGSNMFLRISRDIGTRSISISAILHNDDSRSKFRAHIKDATLLSLIPDVSGWSGMIIINSQSQKDQLDLRTKEHEAVFHSSTGSRVEGSSFL